MKKVLIIARYFGTRIPGLMKYLPEYEWQPILLSSSAWPEEPPPEVNVTRTKYKDSQRFWKKILGLKSQEEIRNRVKETIGVTSGKSLLDRLLTFYGEIVNYPDSEKGWKSFAVQTAEELLQQRNISAILSSSWPVTCHVIAHELKTKYGVPWVADLRDLWSQNHNYSYSRLRRVFDKNLEIRTLSSADALVTVSQSWVDKINKLHAGKDAYAITNGFDPENRELTPIDLTDKFTITYTGNIYGGKQDPTKLLSALASLISEKKMDDADIEVRFYGPRLKWLDIEIATYRLSGVVKQYGAVPHDIAIDKQRESHVLWLLDWDSPEEKGVYPLKVFEYLAAGRPVLATGGMSGNAIDNLLAETNAGIHAPGIEDVKRALLEFYSEYKESGSPVFHGIGTAISKYSQREMAGKFSACLNKISGQ